MENKFCPNCGHPLPEGQRFCGNCGIAAVSAPAASHPSKEVYYAKPKIPGRGLGIASMVLGIIGLVYSIPCVVFACMPAYREPGMEGILSASVFSLLSLIYSIAALCKKNKSGSTISGLLMGAIGLIVYAAAAVLMFML